MFLARVSIAKNVRPLWENGREKCGWKPDYDLHLRKMDGEVACAVIIQLKLQRCHSTGSTKSRNPESGIQKPESGIRKPESKRNFKIQQSEIVQQLSGNNVNENVLFFDS